MVTLKDVEHLLNKTLNELNKAHCSDYNSIHSFFEKNLCTINNILANKHEEFHTKSLTRIKNDKEDISYKVIKDIFKGYSKHYKIIQCLFVIFNEKILQDNVNIFQLKLLKNENGFIIINIINEEKILSSIIYIDEKVILKEILKYTEDEESNTYSLDQRITKMVQNNIQEYDSILIHSIKDYVYNTINKSSVFKSNKIISLLLFIISHDYRNIFFHIQENLDINIVYYGTLKNNLNKIRSLTDKKMEKFISKLGLDSIINFKTDISFSKYSNELGIKFLIYKIGKDIAHVCLSTSRTIYGHFPYLRLVKEMYSVSSLVSSELELLNGKIDNKELVIAHYIPTLVDKIYSKDLNGFKDDIKIGFDVSEEPDGIWVYYSVYCGNNNTTIEPSVNRKFLSYGLEHNDKSSELFKKVKSFFVLK